MTTKALRALPEGSYVRVRMHDDLETVRLLAVKSPTQDELRYGHTSNRVHVRRFTVGGYLDTWFYPREVIDAEQPDERLLRIILRMEEIAGPKPPHRLAGSA